MYLTQKNVFSKNYGAIKLILFLFLVTHSMGPCSAQFTINAGPSIVSFTAPNNFQEFDFVEGNLSKTNPGFHLGGSLMFFERRFPSTGIFQFHVVQSLGAPEELGLGFEDESEIDVILVKYNTLDFMFSNSYFFDLPVNEYFQPYAGWTVGVLLINPIITDLGDYDEEVSFDRIIGFPLGGVLGSLYEFSDFFVYADIHFDVNNLDGFSVKSTFSAGISYKIGDF